MSNFSKGKWIFYDGEPGNSRLQKEISEALDQIDFIRLDGLLDRIANGTAMPQKDFKYISNYKIWEVRFYAANNKKHYRLFYSPESSGELVLVALSFVIKKSNKLSNSVFETAESRLKKWREPQN